MKRFLNKRFIFITLALTSLAAIIFLIRLKEFEPKILTVFPASGMQDVSLNSVIDINFENSVPEEEKTKFFVRIVPGVTFNSTWISPRILRLTPQSDLTSETLYQISVSFDGAEIYTSSFKTIYIKTYTDEENEQLRSMALEVSAAFYQLDATYPFLKKLPLEADNYRVVFDFDQNKFRVRLKMPSTAPEETKQEAEQAALSALTLAEIDITPYGYYVLYLE